MSYKTTIEKLADDYAGAYADYVVSKECDNGTELDIADCDLAEKALHDGIAAAIAKARGRIDKLCITATCYCKLDDETDEVVSLCAAHKDFMDAAIAKAVEVERGFRTVCST